MDVDHQRIEERITEHLASNIGENLQPEIQLIQPKGQISKSRTQLRSRPIHTQTPRTACIMVVRPTITPKIALST
jgi:hypothetical protein